MATIWSIEITKNMKDLEGLGLRSEELNKWFEKFSQFINKSKTQSAKKA